MADDVLVQDLYMPRQKKIVRSDVKPLTCHVCKKELNGLSIAAKVLNGKTIFLCAHHYYSSKPCQITLAN